MKADRLMHSFHYGPILGMDVSTHKPLIVTSGADRSIRVWNYLENTLEVTRYFPEEAQRYTLQYTYLNTIVFRCIRAVSIFLLDFLDL